MNSQKTLWMGDIDSSMNEDSISQIFKEISKKLLILDFDLKNVRIIRDKITGIRQGILF
jgi:RNA recognition motif-containing protein